MTDRKIIEELKKGNTKVFQFLYNHFPMIKRMVLNNSGSEEDAKDIFQNALVIFFKKVKEPDFHLTSKISTYLYAVCENNWKKKLTRDKNMNNLSLDNLADQLSEDEKLHVDDKEKTLVEYIEELLDKLGDPCKSIILLHQFYQLPMIEIANRLDYANEHTVRQQKYKCLQRLRKMIPQSVKEKYLV